MRRRTWLAWLAVALCGASLLGLELWLRHIHPQPVVTASDGPEVLWTFESSHPGSIISSPCLDGERVCLGDQVGPEPLVRTECTEQLIEIDKIADRGRLVGLWEFDPDSGAILFHGADASTRRACPCRR